MPPFAYMESSKHRRQSVAVVGAGGVGGSVAACLALEGWHDVALCARHAADELVFEPPDAKVRLPMRTWVDPDAVTPVDWVMLCTKAHDTASVAPWLARLCNRETHVAVLQNGIGHAARVAPYIGNAKVVPVVVYFNGERLTANHIRFRHSGERDLAVPDDAGGRALARLLEGTCLKTFVCADFNTLQWRKLLLNAVANPITALTRQRLHVLQHVDVRALCMDVLDEAVAVGRASGAAFANDEGPTMLATLLSLSPEFGTSMYTDCMHDKVLEVDALTGAIVEAGEALGIPTPVNRTLLALLRAVSDAARDRMIVAPSAEASPT